MRAGPIPTPRIQCILPGPDSMRANPIPTLRIQYILPGPDSTRACLIPMVSTRAGQGTGEDGNNPERERGARKRGRGRGRTRHRSPGKDVFAPWKNSSSGRPRDFEKEYNQALANPHPPGRVNCGESQIPHKLPISGLIQSGHKASTFCRALMWLLDK